MTLRIKKDDLVKVIAGNQKGKTAKVERTDAKAGVVYLENIGKIKRHIKPSQANPRGGTKEIHRGIAISNVALVVDEAKGRTAKVAYKVNNDTKVRVSRSNGKEL
jgi:large subunit ribosomal protein L24